MFVPVSCTKCGKPFQVPEAALGKLAPCPWCQEVVTALPRRTRCRSGPAGRTYLASNSLNARHRTGAVSGPTLFSSPYCALVRP